MCKSTKATSSYNYVCEECGKGCDIVEVDFGIGPNEFWGSVSNHVDLQLASSCCEGDYRELDYTEFRDYLISKGTDNHLQQELF